MRRLDSASLAAMSLAAWTRSLHARAGDIAAKAVCRSSPTKPTTASTSPSTASPSPPTSGATNQRKPVLYPLIAPDGTTLTRGNPSNLPGERIDHPHHAGLWFNYSNVNNIDYWNNSDAIKPEAPPQIRLHPTTTASSQQRAAPPPGNSSPNPPGTPSPTFPRSAANRRRTYIHQTTRYVFSKLTIDGKPARTIDMTVTLTALANRRLPRRQGRHARHPRRSLPRVGHRKAGGISATPMASPPRSPLATAGATGVYRTSEGKVGDAAGAHAAAGAISPAPRPTASTETIAIIDHPGNPNYPTYWHARDYGLFAVNPLGAPSVRPQTTSLELHPGERSGRDLPLSHPSALPGRHLRRDERRSRRLRQGSSLAKPLGAPIHRELSDGWGTQPLRKPLRRCSLQVTSLSPVILSEAKNPRILLLLFSCHPSPNAQSAAMAAMETLRPGMRTGSFAPCLAGGFAGNHLIHSSFIPVKSSSSRTITVALKSCSREEPAAKRMADTFFKHCLVCSWIVSPTIFPVTGSCGPVPETNTRPAPRTAWL